MSWICFKNESLRWWISVAWHLTCACRAQPRSSELSWGKSAGSVTQCLIVNASWHFLVVTARDGKLNTRRRRPATGAWTKTSAFTASSSLMGRQLWPHLRWMTALWTTAAPRRGAWRQRGQPSIDWTWTRNGLGLFERDFLFSPSRFQLPLVTGRPYSKVTGNFSTFCHLIWFPGNGMCHDATLHLGAWFLHLLWCRWETQACSTRALCVFWQISIVN